MDEGIKQMGKAFIVTLVVLIVQIAGFHYSNSLALLGDSVHVFSDIIAIGTSLIAICAAQFVMLVWLLFAGAGPVLMTVAIFLWGASGPANRRADSDHRVQ